MPFAAAVALEIPDVVMELKALHMVKERAEDVARSTFTTPLEIIVWLTALAVCLIALVWYTNYNNGNYLLILSVASVAVLLLITFFFPLLWLRMILDLCLLVGLFWAARQQAQVTQLSTLPKPSH